MTTPSDPDQDGFEFAGEPEAPDASAAILDEFIPDDADAEEADAPDSADDPLPPAA
ncbi:MAG: hypothetical protein Q7T71_03290 [Herbiconiux sp.]|nr:hypothetical protein [Herbiconiux sp.]